MSEDAINPSASTELNAQPSRDESPTESANTVPNVGAETEQDSVTAEVAVEDGERKSEDEASEAETVVSPEKKDAASRSTHKAIKHEESNSLDSENESTIVVNNSIRKTGSDASPQSSKSMKEVKAQDTNNSSNLSSPNSSPPPGLHPASSAVVDSVKSHSRPSRDGELSAKSHRKRKVQTEEADEKGQKRRHRREVSSEATNHSDRQIRKASKTRSESPPPRTRNRTHSIPSAAPQGVQKRRKPAPLQVGQRRKASEETDGESDDSSSAQGFSHLRKLASLDNSSMSPAKLPHKKLRDRNGRTWLARACAAEEVESVVARIKERPEDLNVADNAGNTPLQIAALEGSYEIVKVLLDAGCDTTCKNIDADTPLIDAVENGHLDVIKLLLKAGLDPRQANAKGEEPLDLLDPEVKNYEAIKKALLSAKEKDKGRRTSEDHHGQPNTARESVPAHSPRASPALPSARSPPSSHGLPPRRRNARSEATRNDLLWVNPTPENLRERAGMGDDAGVSHILDMRASADVESVLAAAKGGHEVCLQLLIAIGNPEQDPDPLESLKAGYNTPMLAAIGRGNVRVIKLLLEQAGFNPTRKLYKDATYFELARERKGSDWQEECRILKEAYDSHKSRKSGAQKNKGVPSPRDSKRTHQEGLTSPRSIKRKPSLTVASKDELNKKGQPVEGKSARQSRLPTGTESAFENKRKHLNIPHRSDSRESSVVISDREASPFRSTQEKKMKRSLSDAGVAGNDQPKPRKRLISGKALKDDQDKKRRSSLVSMASSTSSQEPSRVKSKQSSLPHTSLKEVDPKATSTDSIKKRPRRSASPSQSVSSKPRASSETAKKVKRQRLDSNGNSLKRESPALDPATSNSGNTAPKASTTSSASRNNGAPTAVMGKSAASSVDRLSSPQSSRVDTDSSVHGNKTNSERKASKAHDKVKPAKERGEEQVVDEHHEQSATQLQDEAAAAVAEEEREQQRKELLLKQEEERAAREEAERLAKEQERIREEERAKAEEQRRQQEAEQQAERERREEEARLERKRREEEQLQMQINRERMRREEQERRRIEQEERDRVARIRKQEEEERRRRDTLPNSLRLAAELGPEEAKHPNEITKWLPLCTATGYQLNPDCPEYSRDERWITNIQAAPVLGITDLDLSQYTAWLKLPLDEHHRLSLWRVLRLKLTRFESSPYDKYNMKAEVELDAQTHAKFNALERIFWIRLSDFLDIAPRYPHLASVSLSFDAIALKPIAPPLPPSTEAPVNCYTPLLLNGHHTPVANGNLTNGYH